MATTNRLISLVTGAASGIGKATTLRLHEQGYQVIALDRSPEKLDELLRVCGEGIIPCHFDLSQTEAIPAMLAQLLQTYGPITKLVNNAGVWAGGAITSMSDEAWQLNFDVNVTAPFAFMRALVPAMIEAGGGAIVTVSSRNAFRSSVNNAAYDASKAAVLALTRTAAGEFARDGIRVNAVCPGVIDTPGDGGIQDTLFKKAYTRLIPMDRYGQADEVAATIAFLLSGDASFITGESITIDGGQLACQDNTRFMQIPGLTS